MEWLTHQKFSRAALHDMCVGGLRGTLDAIEGAGLPRASSGC
ncbi:hypothetical protein [Streptomyces sp. NPDC048639]